MDTDRVESFSDGVFAFAITVLVLAIGVPDLGRHSVLPCCGSGRPTSRTG